MSQFELLHLLSRCSAAIAAARTWVPPTSPEIVQLNIADREIRTRMAQLGTTMSVANNHSNTVDESDFLTGGRDA